MVVYVGDDWGDILHAVVGRGRAAVVLPVRVCPVLVVDSAFSGHIISMDDRFKRINGYGLLGRSRIATIISGCPCEYTIGYAINHLMCHMAEGWCNVIITIVCGGSMFHQGQPMLNGPGTAIEQTIRIPQILAVGIAIDIVLIDDGQSIGVELKVFACTSPKNLMGFLNKGANAISGIIRVCELQFSQGSVGFTKAFECVIESKVEHSGEKLAGQYVALAHWICL